MKNKWHAKDEFQALSFKHKTEVIILLPIVTLALFYLFCWVRFLLRFV